MLLLYGIWVPAQLIGVARWCATGRGRVLPADPAVAQMEPSVALEDAARPPVESPRLRGGANGLLCLNQYACFYRFHACHACHRRLLDIARRDLHDLRATGRALTKVSRDTAVTALGAR